MPLSYFIRVFITLHTQCQKVKKAIEPSKESERTSALGKYAFNIFELLRLALCSAVGTPAPLLRHSSCIYISNTNAFKFQILKDNTCTGHSLSPLLARTPTTIHANTFSRVNSSIYVGVYNMMLHNVQVRHFN